MGRRHLDLPVDGKGEINEREAAASVSLNENWTRGSEETGSDFGSFFSLTSLWASGSSRTLEKGQTTVEGVDRSNITDKIHMTACKI